MKKSAIKGNIISMKKIVLTLICITLVLSSCASLRRNPQFTSSQYEYALKSVLLQANEETTQTLYQIISTQESFLPTDYDILRRYSAYIPNLRDCLEENRVLVSVRSINILTLGMDQILSLIADMQIIEPKELITSSDSSASELFEKSHRAEIEGSISSSLEDLEFTSLSRAVRLFNSYIELTQPFNDYNPAALESIDLTSYYTALLTDLYFDTLKEAERLLRTNPNPYQDQLVTEIFGNY